MNKLVTFLIIVTLLLTVGCSDKDEEISCTSHPIGYKYPNGTFVEEDLNFKTNTTMIIEFICE